MLSQYETVTFYTIKIFIVHKKLILINFQLALRSKQNLFSQQKQLPKNQQI